MPEKPRLIPANTNLYEAWFRSQVQKQLSS